jgi:hypothetical protein
VENIRALMKHRKRVAVTRFVPKYVCFWFFMPKKCLFCVHGPSIVPDDNTFLALCSFKQAYSSILFFFCSTTDRFIMSKRSVDAAEDLASLHSGAKFQKQASSDSAVSAIAASPTTNAQSNNVWRTGVSQKYKGAIYWYNTVTGVTQWTDPNIAPQQPSKPSEPYVAPKPAMSKFEEMLEKERLAVAVTAPECPREIATADLPALVRRLCTECALVKTFPNDAKVEHSVVFDLADCDVAMVTRAVQEDQILKTRLKAIGKGGRPIDLPSFWDVWAENAEFRARIASSDDPNEAKWKLQTEFGYKIATTFMPPYAKAMYMHFGAATVLDPCAGWGDRLVGAAAAAAAGTVQKYVCFDPNLTLRPGYAALMKLFGHEVTALSDQKIEFSNGFEVRCQPFEEGAKQLRTCSFDLVFTSPPFFDYEQYNPGNPQYVDWLDQFYKPLFVQACRCVKVGHFVCIHVGDTSAGNINEFMKVTMRMHCPLKLVKRVGLQGKMSEQTRSVWVFEKRKESDWLAGPGQSSVNFYDESS